MSVSFKGNNIGHFSRDNISLLYSEFEIKTPAPDSITCKSDVDYTTHLIMQKEDDKTFRLISSQITTRVHNQSVYIYDHTCNLITRYESDRESNSGGSLSISIENTNLISNIIVPEISEGKVVLVLSNYSLLHSCSSERVKNNLINRDFSMFSEKYDTSNMVLYVEKLVKKELDKYLTTPLTDIFESVVTNDSSNYLINILVEDLMGKTICGSKPTFQSILSFSNPGTNIEAIYKYNLGSSSDITLTNRTRGRIQVNSSGHTNKCICFMIITTEFCDPTELVLCDEYTGNKFTSTPMDISLMEDVVSFKYINNLLCDFIFHKELCYSGSRTKTTDESIDFLRENKLESFEYMFGEERTQIKSSNKRVEALINIGSRLYTNIMSKIRELSNYKKSMKHNKSKEYSSNLYQQQSCLPMRPINLARQVSIYTDE